MEAEKISDEIMALFGKRGKEGGRRLASQSGKRQFIPELDGCRRDAKGRRLLAYAAFADAGQKSRLGRDRQTGQARDRSGVSKGFAQVG